MGISLVLSLKCVPKPSRFIAPGTNLETDVNVPMREVKCACRKKGSPGEIQGTVNGRCRISYMWH